MVPIKSAWRGSSPVSIVLYCFSYSIVISYASFAGVSDLNAEEATPSLREGRIPIPSVLTLKDSEVIFQKYSYDLLVTEASILNARGDEESAGIVYNPALTGGYSRAYDYNRALCPPPCSSGNSNFAGISDQGAILDILTNKRGLRLRVARSAYQAARLSGEFAKKSLLFQLRQQFTQTGLSKEYLNFSREIEKIAKANYNIVKVRFQAGAISEADLARADAAQLEASQGVDSALMNYETNRVALMFLLGVRSAPLPDFDISVDQLHSLRVRGEYTDSRDKLIALALEARSDLKAARFQAMRAKSAVTLSKVKIFPDVALSVQVDQPQPIHNYYLKSYEASQISSQLPTPLSYAGPSYVAPSLSVAATFPLPLFYQNQGEITKAEADLKTQDALERKSEAQVVNDVGAAFSFFQASKRKVDRMESGLLGQSKRAFDLVQIQYEKGAASLLDLLVAQQTYISTNQEYYQNLSDYLSSIFQLEQAVGMELRK